MYLQLLAYFKTKSKLTYCGIAIAGWYFALGGNAMAQTPATESANDWFEDNISSELFASATIANGDLAGEDREHRSDNPLGDLQVAQVTAPVPVNLPIIIFPSLLPRLLSPSNPIFMPINSVLTPELIFAPNNTPAVSPSNAPVAPKPASTRDPRFVIAPQVVDPKVWH